MKRRGYTNKPRPQPGSGWRAGQIKWKQPGKMSISASNKVKMANYLYFTSGICDMSV